jgi:hypothetical protein
VYVSHAVRTSGTRTGSGEVIVQTKAMDTLAETVEVVVFRKAVNELNELVLIDKLGALGSEEYISCGLSANVEPERWVVAPVEL